MAKMYDKSELRVINGNFVNEKEEVLYPVVSISSFINELFGRIDGKPVTEYVPEVPEDKGTDVFDIPTFDNGGKHLIQFSTPELDAEHFRAEKMRKEIAMRQFQQEINKEIEYCERELNWFDAEEVPMLSSSEVTSCCSMGPIKYDVPVLALRSKDIIEMMMVAHGLPEGWQDWHMFRENSFDYITKEDDNEQE